MTGDHPRRPRPRPRRGYTLIELVATMTIIAAIGSVASAIMVEVVNAYSAAATSAQIHTEMSIGFDRLVRELRRIPLDDGASDTAPHIDDVTPTSLEWRDADGDDYAITLGGGILRLAVDGGPAAHMLRDVSAFNVQAIDDDGIDMAATLTGDACDGIRRIHLSATVTRHGVSETLQTLVYLRATMSQEP